MDSPRGDRQAGDKLATAAGAGGRQAPESRGLLHSKMATGRPEDVAPSRGLRRGAGGPAGVCRRAVG